MMLNMTGLKQDYTIGKLCQLLAACSGNLYDIILSIVLYRFINESLDNYSIQRHDKEKNELTVQHNHNPLKHHTVI